MDEGGQFGRFGDDLHFRGRRTPLPREQQTLSRQDTREFEQLGLIELRLQRVEFVGNRTRRSRNHIDIDLFSPELDLTADSSTRVARQVDRNHIH